ncbi:hypothetical protein DL96DRAFT_942739 [Flagelloscypha sp. PMI_526]|nr:hypothetical protein DL96DRAFT_942739 [Flagelloscypha sp. PMI_526]
MAGPRKAVKPSSSSSTRATPITSTNNPSTKNWLTQIVIPIFIALVFSGAFFFLGPPTTLHISDVSKTEDHVNIEEDNGGLSWKIVDVGNGQGKGVIAVKDIKQGELVIRQTADEIKSAGSHGTYSAAINHGCGGTVNVAWHWRVPEPTHQDPTKAPPPEGHDEGSESDEKLVETHTEEPTPPPSSQPELRIYALKDIRKGEELLGSYIDTRLPRADRLDQLWEQYWFNCTCHVCSLPTESEESQSREARLTRMGEVYARFLGWTEGHIPGPEAIRLARELWTLSEKEGYFHGRAQLAEEATYISAAHSDASATQEWNDLAYEWAKIEFGEDNERTLRAKILRVNDVHSHSVWGWAEALIVGGPQLDHKQET